MKKYLLLKKLALILQPELGTKLKNSILTPKPGNWRVGSHRMGETIPKETNKVSLHFYAKSLTDLYGDYGKGGKLCCF